MLHAVKWGAVSKTPIYAPAPTRAPLSRSSCELNLNSSRNSLWSRTMRELLEKCVNKPWTTRASNAWSTHGRVSGTKISDPVVNYVRTTREFEVSCSWTIHGISWQSLPGAHWQASSCIVTINSRRVHEQFAHSSRPRHFILSWPKFWKFQNFCPNMSRQVNASLRLVCALARLESCQCVPQNRASVKLALHANFALR